MSLIRNALKADKKCLWKLLYNFGWKGLRGFRKFEKRKKDGKVFPAFQFISVTNHCNLHCQGCWVSKAGIGQDLDILKVHQIINESKKQGSYFFGILGGEPLMYPQLLEIFQKHPDCYFQLFTNGTLLSREFGQQLRKLSNVSPLISLEGDLEVADIRRGSRDVYNRTMNAIENAVAAKLVTGVAVSVCKSNIKMALSDEFVQMLHQKGVLYIWYYIYRPVGENPCYELALDAGDMERLRRFLVDGRTRLPMVLVDSYWDADGNPFCPAIEGLSHHINPGGQIEPCPVIQYSAESIGSLNIIETYENSVFLKDFKTEAGKLTHGCILMEDPGWLVHFANSRRAKNSSNRPDYSELLLRGKIVPSHGSCPVIPEKSRVYRFVKKRAFFGLGAYG